jgi:hypothetical protein
LSFACLRRWLFPLILFVPAVLPLAARDAYVLISGGGHPIQQ